MTNRNVHALGESRAFSLAAAKLTAETVWLAEGASAFRVRREKAAPFQWVQGPPGDRSVADDNRTGALLRNLGEYPLNLGRCRLLEQHRDQRVALLAYVEIG